jgi:outer membrane protein assembly factor BamE
MRVRLIPLALVLLTACSTTQLPIAPHKIDVQQGNVIDQDVLDKLKPGLSRSQVRFLLGTPLMVDPFRDNRWDYVYNYRSAGKLTAEKRVTLFFDRDVLSRIETNGLNQPPATMAPTSTKAEAAPPAPASAPGAPPVQQSESPSSATAALVEPAATQPGSNEKPGQQAPASAAAAQVTQAAASPRIKGPVKGVKKAAKAKTRSRVPTSVVPPLGATPSKASPKQLENAPPQSVSLQSETNAGGLKPDVMPEFPRTTAASDGEAPVLAAVKAWAKAWSDRDEEAYFSSYARNFKPSGSLDKAEWEKRRRLLLNLSKKIEVRIDSPVVEFPAEGRALITFNQSYRSAAHQDIVVKQLIMGLQDGRWLIIEERVLTVPQSKKKK